MAPPGWGRGLVERAPRGQVGVFPGGNIEAHGASPQLDVADDTVQNWPRGTTPSIPRRSGQSEVSRSRDRDTRSCSVCHLLRGPSGRKVRGVPSRASAPRTMAKDFRRLAPKREMACSLQTLRINSKELSIHQTSVPVVGWPEVMTLFIIEKKAACVAHPVPCGWAAVLEKVIGG